jgi:diguanylate cyclase (GGDEF)-like protein
MDDHQLHNQTYSLRASVLTGVSLFLTLVFFPLIIFHIISHSEAMLILTETTIFTYSLLTYIRIRDKQYSQKYVLYYAYFILFMLVLRTSWQSIDNGIFIWSCIIPIMLYLMLGTKHALYATGLFFIVQVSITTIKLIQSGLNDAPAIAFNLSLCYCAIWIISHRYESNRTDIEQSLVYLASRDALTGAHNRLALSMNFHQFSHGKRADKQLCLLILDIDYFKLINDRFGHDIGDKVLIETSLILSRIVGDNNLFRIGGEEFCVTLFGKDLDSAKQIGEELCDTVSNHQFFFNNRHLQLTLSIGICQYRQGDNLSDILKMADIELYRAKANGRNQVMICQLQTTIQADSEKYPA